MQRQPRSHSDAEQLLQVADLISKTAQTVVLEWSKEAEALSSNVSDSGSAADLKASVQILPSHDLYDAQRTMLAAVGKLTELVSEPSTRIMEVATSFEESRALFIAAERRIPNILAAKDKDGGMIVSEISKETKIESRKLSRILRYLCSIGIFQQTGPDVFANNSISMALVANEPLRAHVQLVNLDCFSAADRLPKTLLDPERGPSYDITKASWQDAVGTSKSRWEWLEERVEQGKSIGSGHYPGVPSPPLEPERKGDDGLVPRPELEIMGLAMIGGGQTLGVAHVYDFPWSSLGRSLIVDVGGGVGGFSLQLSKAYPNLQFIVQDRGPVIKQGLERVWPKENPEALKAGRVKFVEHNFFSKNPTEGADIYFLRHVLHDWPDVECVQILSNIRASMAPNSRLLICEQVMNTTTSNPNTNMKSAPSPLPANYGYYMRFSHARDLTLMACVNGIERTPEEFEVIIEAAGLEMKQIWECRSQVSLIEVVLPLKSSVQ